MQYVNINLEQMDTLYHMYVCMYVCTCRVGLVVRKPESVTSSTVSPIDRTRVALLKDTTM